MARFRRALLLVEKERQAEREGQPIRYIRPHPETQRLQIDNAEWKRRERLEDAKELVEECGLARLDDRELAAFLEEQRHRPWPVGSVEGVPELADRDYESAQTWIYRGHVVLTLDDHGDPRNLLDSRNEVAEIVAERPAVQEDEFAELRARLPDVTTVPSGERARLAAVAHWDEECRRALITNALGPPPELRERLARPHIPAAVRREVWRRDEGRCTECGSNKRLEFDHIIPISRGGSNTARNLQLLCERCNRHKSGRI
jgi:5-methylcytosine-specific restriction endonuclease McrA